MNMPFVLRSTYEAVRARREALSVAFKSSEQQIVRLIDDRYHMTERIEDYKRTCETRDEIIAGHEHHIESLTDDLAAAKQMAELSERRRVESEVRCNEAIARERDWAARYEVLMNRTMQLKLSGAVEVPIAPVPGPAKEPDMIMQAINDTCRGKPPAVKRGMIRQMREDRANDVPDMDILIRIQQGEPTEGVPT